MRERFAEDVSSRFPASIIEDARAALSASARGKRRDRWRLPYRFGVLVRIASETRAELEIVNRYTSQLGGQQGPAVRE